MEIERKFLIEKLPENYEKFPFVEMEQAYLCTDPVIRVRREDEEYYLTYKGKGGIMREEYNLSLTRESYNHLLDKADGNVIHKRRYKIPYEGGLTIELDIFKEQLESLIYAEVEFASLEDASAFTPPSWFTEEVTEDHRYSNSSLSYKGIPK